MIVYHWRHQETSVTHAVYLIVIVTRAACAYRSIYYIIIANPFL